jgi:hypothetical protein
MTSSIEQPLPTEERRFHTYIGSSIPWGIRLMWLCFWIFAIAYAMKYLLPAIQVELVSPP